MSNKSIIFTGADPGKSGAIAFLDEERKIINVMDFKKFTYTDVVNFIKECQNYRIIGMIEKVHSMPAQGVKSVFTFGEQFGIVKGIFLTAGISHEFVTPQKWQRRLLCLSKGDKNVTKAKAQELFPNYKITHAIADALLIAEYCRKVFLGGNNK